jgi:hypothetical protein
LARSKSRDASATTSECGDFMIPGVTFAIPILAVDSIPQRPSVASSCVDPRKVVERSDHVLNKFTGRSVDRPLLGDLATAMHDD